MVARILTLPFAVLLLASLGGCGDDHPGSNDNDQNNQNTAQAICGDAVQEAAEECDDGAANSDTAPDACRTDCRAARCGDGVTDAGEDCDDGPQNSAEVPDACRPGCVPPACGDGVVDPGRGERCDDGNTVNGDGCSDQCVPEYCGNGQIEPGEVCDDGNTRSGDGCSADCQSWEICGNGIVDVGAGEQCDEGEDNSDEANATCRSDCRARRCGDGILDDGAGEDCEPGQPLSITCDDYGYYAGTLGCTSGCRFDLTACVGTCGDDHVDAGREVCDGSDLAGRSCIDFGFDRGVLGCTLDCRARTTACERIGWVREQTPTTRWLNAVWGTSPENIYAVGLAGTAIRWDGMIWSPTPVPTNEDLYAVGGSGPDDVFVADLQGGIYRFDGAHWSTTADLSEDYVVDFWVPSPGLAYAVTRERGEVWRWNGATWSLIGLPTGQGLRAVWGTDPGDVLVGGVGGSLARFDGTTWTPMSAPVDARGVLDLWGDGQGNVYAVGGEGFLWQREGDTWVPRSPPPTVAYPSAIHGDGYGHLYIADRYGRIHHYDPASRIWTEAETPGETLLALWGQGNEAQVAVGVNGIALHYSGATWTRTYSYDLHADVLHDAWGVSPEHLWAVGDGPYSLNRFDGQGWNTVWMDGLYLDLHGVWLAARFDAFAVGEQGLFLRHDGNHHTVIATGTPRTLRGVWGTGPTDVHLVGDGGALLHWNGTSVTAVANPSTAGLERVWGTAGEVWAVGASGTVLHRPQGSPIWSVQPTPTTARLRDVHGTGPDDVWAVGHGGTVIHWDGIAWTAVQAPTSADLITVWAFGPTDVFLGGATNRLLHWDGVRFTPLATGVTTDVNALWGSGEHLIYVGALARHRRLLRERPWTCVATEAACCNGQDDDCDGLVDAADPDCTAALVEVCNDGIDNDCDGLVDQCDPDCGSPPVEDCTDELDNDCDGLVDCADPDCAGEPQCASPDLCVPHTSLVCNAAPVPGTNLGGPSNRSVYTCGTWQQSGPEAYYRFVAPATGTATVTLAGLTDDVDLYVIGHQPASGCVDSTTCLESVNVGAVDESITWPVVAGEIYYLVVEGYGGATASFTIRVTCS